MLDRGNPDIDVDALMARVQHEVLRRQFGDAPAAGSLLDGIDTAAVDSLIDAAALRAAPRHRWPARLNVFPFNLKAVQRFCLRALAWLFRDQQAFNAALLQALRESLTINVRLHASMREMEARIRRLEGRE
jgi:transposase